MCFVIIKCTWTNEKGTSKLQEPIPAFSSLLLAKAQELKETMFFLCPTFPYWDPPSLSKIHKNKHLNLSLIWMRFSFILNEQISPAVYITLRQKGDKTVGNQSSLPSFEAQMIWKGTNWERWKHKTIQMKWKINLMGCPTKSYNDFKCPLSHFLNFWGKQLMLFCIIFFLMHTTDICQDLEEHSVLS